MPAQGAKVNLTLLYKLLYPNVPLISISKMTNNQQPTRLPDGQATNKGFTIVESLVAITILVLVVTGVTSAIQTGISSYIFSKDQIIAFYLAQEGVEQIRNIRDENSLKNPQQPWLTGIASSVSDSCYFGKACKIEPVFSSVATECSGGPGNCPVLRQSS